MSRKPFAAALFALLIPLTVLPALPAGAQEDERSRSWNQPVEPFRIAGNLYYVGANDIASSGAMSSSMPAISRTIAVTGAKVAVSP